MPQYLIHPKHPIRTFLYIVLALGLIVGGYLTFKASQMSTEGRSKAALEYKTYESWEFDGTDTEGWVGTNLTNMKVGGEVLKGIVGTAKANPTLTHKDVSLGQGNKMFEISLAIDDPHVQWIKDPPPTVEEYTLNVVYAVSPDGYKKKQLVIKGKTDKLMNNLTARFPEIGKLDINNLVLEFVNLKSGTIVTIASIKVTDRIGTKPSLTPKPSSPPPECSVTLSDYKVSTPCEKDNYRYVSYSCSNGSIKGIEGSPTSCKSTSDWKKIASDICAAQKCVPTPPITPQPTIIGLPTATPAPDSDLPDLTIPDGTINVYPKTIKAGDPVGIYFQIVNHGKKESKAPYVYTEQAGGFSEIGPKNTCVNSTILKPGEECRSSYEFLFKTIGKKVMKILLDPNNEVKESNEDNNAFSVSLLVK